MHWNLNGLTEIKHMLGFTSFFYSKNVRIKIIIPLNCSKSKFSAHLGLRDWPHSFHGRLWFQLARHLFGWSSTEERIYHQLQGRNQRALSSFFIFSSLFFYFLLRVLIWAWTNTGSFRLFFVFSPPNANCLDVKNLSRQVT